MGLTVRDNLALVISHRVRAKEARRAFGVRRPPEVWYLKRAGEVLLTRLALAHLICRCETGAVFC
jgi:hypothetical protein